MKACVRCFEIKDFKEFSRATFKRSFDGHRNDCRACVLAYRRSWWKKNRERNLLKKRVFYARNRKRCLMQKREWNLNNPEKYKQHCRRKYLNYIKKYPGRMYLFQQISRYGEYAEVRNLAILLKKEIKNA